MEKENQKILTAEIKPFLVDYLAYAKAVIETRNGKQNLLLNLLTVITITIFSQNINFKILKMVMCGLTKLTLLN